MSICLSISMRASAAKSVRVSIAGYDFDISPFEGSVSIAEVDGRVCVRHFPVDESLVHLPLEVLPVSSDETESSITIDDSVSTVNHVEIFDSSVHVEEATSIIEALQSEVVPSEDSKQLVPLFQYLAELRRKISIEEKVPPYIIFKNDTLQEIERLKPQDMEAMKSIRGIGEAKLSKYGERFLEVVKSYIGGVHPA